MRTDETAVRHRFGQFLLQPAERRLLADGVDVPLGPRAFDLLMVLVQNSGRLVSKEQLLDIVWPRAIVEENSLQAQVSALRKALGRSAIDTVSGRGYRFTLAVTTDAAATVRDAPPRVPMHNLPRPFSSFIGREKEIVELSQAMRQSRLLTLTGAGGCGKTRLAIQLADGVQSMFADGVWLVELATLANPALVNRALADVLGLQESPSMPILQVITEYLASRRTLLVLDNAEHLLGACARLADEILKRAAHTSVLVTSRESLGVTGEQTFRVPSLSVPVPGSDSRSERVLQFESVRLFVERARLQRPHFAVTEQNAAALASLCRRLDGIPLAIELAAARMRTLSPEEIDLRLDQRFSLLTDGSRTALPRHRTLRSLIDWSYDLLGESERETLCRSAVFSDGWTLEAAEEVCGAGAAEQEAIFDRLSALAGKSLVAADESGGRTRYRMLETVRQYGLEHLHARREEATSRDRHLSYFVRVAEDASPHLAGTQQQLWLNRLDEERDNLRAAVAWAITSGNATDGLRLAGAIWRFWWMRGYIGEGNDALAQLLALPGQPPDAGVRGAGLDAAGQMAYFQGNYATARRFQEEALAIHRQSGDRACVAGALSGLATTLKEQGDTSRFRKLQEESLEIFRALGAMRQVAGLLSNMGTAARDCGNLDEARQLLEESLGIRREVVDKWGIATSLLNLAGVALDRHDLVAARSLGEESLSLYRELSERRGVAYALGSLATLACDVSDWQLARARMSEGLSILVELSDQSGVAQALDLLARSWMVDRPAFAARIWGAAEALRHRIGYPRYPAARAAHESRLAATRQALSDDAAFETATTHGMKLSWKDLGEFISQ